MTGLKYRAQKASRVLGQCQGLPSEDTAVFSGFNSQDGRGPVEHPWLSETPFIVPSTVIQLDLFSVF